MGIYPKITEIRILERLYNSWVHCSIIHNGKETNWMHTDEWIKKTGYIHTVGYYSCLRRNNKLQHGTTWINCEDIMSSEINQTQKDKYYIIPIIPNSKNQRVEWWVLEVGVGKMGELLINVSVKQDEWALEICTPLSAVNNTVSYT